MSLNVSKNIQFITIVIRQNIINSVNAQQSSEILLSTKFNRQNTANYNINTTRSTAGLYNTSVSSSISSAYSVFTVHSDYRLANMTHK